MRKILLFTLIAVFLGVGSAFAATLNLTGWTDITTYDMMGNSTTFGPGTDTRTTTFDYSITNTATGAVTSVAKGTSILEDGETEYNTQTGQSWDLEGVFLNKSTSQVAIVGGYDFKLGYGGFGPGDIFISTDFNLDVPALGEPNGGAVTSGSRGYEVVLDVNAAADAYALYNSNVTGVQWETQNVFYNDLVGSPLSGASPWRIYDPNTNASQGNFGITYANTVTNSGLNGASPRYALIFDLNDIFGAQFEDLTLFLHYTMECGNDSLAGAIENYSGTPPVPEPATLLLLGTGLVGLAGMGRKRFSKKS